MSEAVALIRLSGITKTYGSGQAAFQALKGIDLAIDAGDFVAIMGPSGSGKSTAMNILGCLDTPSSGSYEFEGVKVEQLSRNERALLRRNYLGFVFQGFNLLPKLTSLDNVALPLMYAGMGRQARRQQAQAVLERVGLGERSHHTPLQLSGGQQQRVAIARAMATRPRIIFADEPTGNLDSETSHQVMGLFSQLNRDEGITLVLVTHEADIAAYARRRIRFQDGRVVEDVPQKAVTA